jgi:hypothetical protein
MEQPMEFVFEGRTYLIGRRNFEVEELFRRYLERNALSVIQRHAEALSAPDYQLHMDAWRRDCAAEIFDFEGYHALMAGMSRPGQKELAYLTLGTFNKTAGVNRALIERLWSDKAKWAEFQTIQGAVNADPNGTSPPAASTGCPTPGGTGCPTPGGTERPTPGDTAAGAPKAPADSASPA